MNTQKEHNCKDYKCTNCDGTFHYSFCTICHKDIGTETCAEVIEKATEKK